MQSGLLTVCSGMSFTWANVKINWLSTFGEIGPRPNP
jgi:hypothetical protein